MFRSACVLFVCPLLAAAAPVPKVSEKEQIEKKFGTIEDPEKDCQFSLDGDKLKITMKGGKQYDWDLNGKVKNCPRVLKEVKGDFVVTVKAYAELPENAKLADKVASKWTEVGAGVIIIPDEKQAWRAGTHDFSDGKRHPMIVIPNSSGPSGVPVEKIGDGPWVRLTKKGDKLSMTVSDDGKSWAKGLTMGCGTNESFRVGVYGVSNLSVDVTVTLSEFSVEPLKEEKKEDKK